ncbi:MAG: HTH domain-containing protein [Polyangiales bacterium]
MTFTEAAEVVLRQVGKPLHFKKITQLAIEQNLLSHVGKTPEITMSTRLTTMTKKDKGDAPIVRVKPGVFALRVWGEAAVAAAADIEETEEPVLPEGAEEEAEREEMPPPSAEEREREDLLNIAQTIFAAEDDDDLPVLADPPPKPAPAAPNGDQAAAGEGGNRRRRRRRRRRGGERSEVSADGTPLADDAAEFEGDDEESDAEPELRADSGEGEEPRERSDEASEPVEGEEARAEGAEAPVEGAEAREPRRERSDRSDRGERDRGRSDRSDRGERNDRGDRADRAERGDRPERSDRADRGERAERADRPERGERGERGDRERGRGERSDRERGDRDRNDRDRDRDRDRSERGDRSDRADRDRAPSEDTTVEAGRDAADLVVSLLQRRDDRNPVPFRTLVDDAIRGNRLSGDANVLAASLAASARADCSRREARGERARLRVQGSRVALVEWSLGSDVARAEDEALVALERLRDAARRQLVRKLNELPQSAFIELIAVTLERVGLTNLRSIRRAGASQGELFVTGTARVAGEEIAAAVLLKRGGEVGRERVIELRGSMHHFNHARAAWIVTTGSILSGAREEASAPEAAPVTLVDGQLLSRWMDEHGVGVRHARIAIPYVDLDLFDALRG